MGSVKMNSQRQDENLNRIPQKSITNLTMVDTMLDNRKSSLIMGISQQEQTNGLPNRNTKNRNEVIDNQESFRPNILEVETLIPVDYVYKDVTLPMIFVNKRISGISIEEQFLLVQEDIEEVIQYFVVGGVTPDEATISKFFVSHPGTMIYSPQLVKTIVSLEHFDVSNPMCNQNTVHVFHEE